MNRAERRANKAEPIVTLTITEAQRNETLPHVADGELVTIACRRWNGGVVEACDPGQETPFRIKVLQ